MLLSVWIVCAYGSPTPTKPPLPSVAVVPDTYTKGPRRTAREYPTSCSHTVPLVTFSRLIESPPNAAVHFTRCSAHGFRERLAHEDGYELLLARTRQFRLVRPGRRIQRDAVHGEVTEKERDQLTGGRLSDPPVAAETAASQKVPGRPLGAEDGQRLSAGLRGEGQ